MTASGRPLLVEVAGPAGAGKTTLACELQEAVPGSRIGLPAGPAARGALARLGPPLAAARFSSRGRGWTRPELRSLGYLATWGRGEPCSSSLVVLDHGPLFRLASLLWDGPPMVHTAAFTRLWRDLAARWAGLLDLVVVLDADDEVLRSRIDERPRRHRIRHAAQVDADAFLARCREGFATALAELDRAGTPVLRLDTAGRHPADLVDEVRAQLTGAVNAS